MVATSKKPTKRPATKQKKKLGDTAESKKGLDEATKPDTKINEIEITTKTLESIKNEEKITNARKKTVRKSINMPKSKKKRVNKSELATDDAIDKSDSTAGIKEVEKVTKTDEKPKKGTVKKATQPKKTVNAKASVNKTIEQKKPIEKINEKKGKGNDKRSTTPTVTKNEIKRGRGRPAKSPKNIESKTQQNDASQSEISSPEAGSTISRKKDLQKNPVNKKKSVKRDVPKKISNTKARVKRKLTKEDSVDMNSITENKAASEKISEAIGAITNKGQKNIESDFEKSSIVHLKKALVKNEKIVSEAKQKTEGSGESSNLGRKDTKAENIFIETSTNGAQLDDVSTESTNKFKNKKVKNNTISTENKTEVVNSKSEKIEKEHYEEGERKENAIISENKADDEQNLKNIIDSRITDLKENKTNNESQEDSNEKITDKIPEKTTPLKDSINQVKISAFDSHSDNQLKNESEKSLNDAEVDITRQDIQEKAINEMLIEQKDFNRSVDFEEKCEKNSEEIKERMHKNAMHAEDNDETNNNNKTDTKNTEQLNQNINEKQKIAQSVAETQEIAQKDSQVNNSEEKEDETSKVKQVETNSNQNKSEQGLKSPNRDNDTENTKETEESNKRVEESHFKEGSNSLENPKEEKISVENLKEEEKSVENPKEEEKSIENLQEAHVSEKEEIKKNEENSDLPAGVKTVNTAETNGAEEKNTKSINEIKSEPENIPNSNEEKHENQSKEIKDQIIEKKSSNSKQALPEVKPITRTHSANRLINTGNRTKSKSGEHHPLFKQAYAENKGQATVTEKVKLQTISTPQKPEKKQPRLPKSSTGHKKQRLEKTKKQQIVAEEQEASKNRGRRPSTEKGLKLKNTFHTKLAICPNRQYFCFYTPNSSNFSLNYMEHTLFTKTLDSPYLKLRFVSDNLLLIVHFYYIQIINIHNRNVEVMYKEPGLINAYYSRRNKVLLLEKEDTAVHILLDTEKRHQFPKTSLKFINDKIYVNYLNILTEYDIFMTELQRFSCHRLSDFYLHEDFLFTLSNNQLIVSNVEPILEVTANKLFVTDSHIFTYHASKKDDTKEVKIFKKTEMIPELVKTVNCMSYKVCKEKTFIYIFENKLYFLIL